MDGRRRARLKRLLDGFYRRLDSGALVFDPLQFPHRLNSPDDREIAAFLAASLAYGHGKIINQHVADVLNRMGNSPFRFVLAFDPKKDTSRFDGFVHRFNSGRDLAVLCYLLKQVLRAYGSLKASFLTGYDPDDQDIGRALTCLVEGLLRLDVSPFYAEGILPQKAGVRFFLPSPRDGSACKRLNLFLRWMVRKDYLDLGLWPEVTPSKLVMPVDVHVSRISQRLGLTHLKSPCWRMAEEITRNLKALDPEDPVKYDFALSHPVLLKEGQGLLSSCP
ncbi:MAG: TIGR02757 family protein [candidate division NC10 bacterium]|nr:TIGR02757 family protein [candidate division NC10 bacterium]